MKLNKPGEQRTRFSTREVLHGLEKGDAGHLTEIFTPEKCLEISNSLNTQLAAIENTVQDESMDPFDFDNRHQRLVEIIFQLGVIEKFLKRDIVSNELKQKAQRFIGGYRFILLIGRRTGDVSINTVADDFSFLSKLFQVCPELRKDCVNIADENGMQALRLAFENIKKDLPKALQTASSMVVLWPDRKEIIQSMIVNGLKDVLIRTMQYEKTPEIIRTFLGIYASAILVHPDWKRDLSLTQLQFQKAYSGTAMDIHTFLEVAKNEAILMADDCFIDEQGIIQLAPPAFKMEKLSALPERLGIWVKKLQWSWKSIWRAFRKIVEFGYLWGTWVQQRRWQYVSNWCE